MTVVTPPDTPETTPPPDLTAAACYARAAAMLREADAAAGTTMPEYLAGMHRSAAQWRELGDRLRDAAPADATRREVSDRLAAYTGLFGHLADKVAELYPEVPAGAMLDEAGDRDVVAICTTVARLLDKLATDRHLSSSRNAEHAEALRAAQAEADQADRDRDEMRANYDGACRTIAAMHAAAVGEVRGPIRGVVEDVADVADQLHGANAEVEEFRAEVRRLRGRWADETRALRAARVELREEVARREQAEESRDEALTRARDAGRREGEAREAEAHVRADLVQAIAAADSLAAARDEARAVANANHDEALAYAGQLARLVDALRDRYPLLWLRLVTAGPSTDRNALVDHVVKLLDEHVAWLTATRGGPGKPAPGELARVDGVLYRFDGAHWSIAPEANAEPVNTEAPPPAATVQWEPTPGAGPAAPLATLPPRLQAPPLDEVLHQVAARAARRAHPHAHAGHVPPPGTSGPTDRF